MILYIVTGKEGEEAYKEISKNVDIKGKNIYVNLMSL